MWIKNLICVYFADDCDDKLASTDENDLNSSPHGFISKSKLSINLSLVDEQLHAGSVGGGGKLKQTRIEIIGGSPKIESTV